AAKPEQETGKPKPAEKEAPHVERPSGFARDILNEDGRENQADDADRYIDPENPAPVKIGGDKAAEEGPHDRPKKGGDRQIGQSVHEFGAFDGTQEQQPSDRNHHRAAETLDDSGADKSRQGRRHAA